MHRVHSLRVKRAVREADHLPPFHLHVVPRLTISGAISTLPYMTLWHEQGPLSFYIYDELLTSLLKTYTLCCNVLQSNQCPQGCSENEDSSLLGSYILSAGKYVDLNLQQICAENLKSSILIMTELFRIITIFY